MPARQNRHAELRNGGAPADAEAEQSRAAPGRRWSVRVHWGIVFAIAASLVLWLAIKTLIDLAF